MSIQFIDHLVFGVKDIVETEKFYSAFLGKPAFQGEEHLIYAAGETRLFFVLPNKAWEPRDKDKGGFNHMAFGVKTLEELRTLAQTLTEAGIKHSGIKLDQQGGKEYIWFDDPEGLRVELYLRA